MTEQEFRVKDLMTSYEAYLRSSFAELWGKVTIDPAQLEAFSVIGGLLSRQVTLSIQMVRSPATWNGHSAPLFLRAMTDLHIALAWIMKDLPDRAKKYILHGLGEEKLLMEHYKKDLEERPENVNAAQIEELVRVKQLWINSQRAEFFVAVNLGHWAQLDYRKMAAEADCESLYKFAYKPFSHAAHNMWPHVSMYNSRICENPLHRHHLVPELVDTQLDPDYLYRSCKYVDKAYQLFLDKFSVGIKSPMPLQWWNSYFSSADDNTAEPGQVSEG